MAPSGPKKAWRLWRHCCCRYGFFPLLVVPIVTLGCLVTLYSSTGCKFIEIDIGFAPTNEGWNATSPYQFGILYYHNASAGHDNPYQDSFHSGCVEYSDTFYENFIGGDRTFKMTQIMTLISCASSPLAMVSSNSCIDEASVQVLTEHGSCLYPKFIRLKPSLSHSTFKCTNT